MGGKLVNIIPLGSGDLKRYLGKLFGVTTTSEVIIFRRRNLLGWTWS